MSTMSGPAVDAMPVSVQGAMTESGNLPRLVWLSPREREVLRLRAEGLTSVQVAWRLQISEQTVKNHMRRVFLKLGVDNLIEAMWVEGWVKLPDVDGPRAVAQCDYVARCGRRDQHRGKHDDFREVMG